MYDLERGVFGGWKSTICLGVECDLALKEQGADPISNIKWQQKRECQGCVVDEDWKTIMEGPDSPRTRVIAISSPLAGTGLFRAVVTYEAVFDDNGNNITPSPTTTPVRSVTVVPADGVVIKDYDVNPLFFGSFFTLALAPTFEGKEVPTYPYLDVFEKISFVTPRIDDPFQGEWGPQPQHINPLNPKRIVIGLDLIYDDKQINFPLTEPQVGNGELDHEYNQRIGLLYKDMCKKLFIKDIGAINNKYYKVDGIHWRGEITKE